MSIVLSFNEILQFCVVLSLLFSRNRHNDNNNKRALYNELLIQFIIIIIFVFLAHKSFPFSLDMCSNTQSTLRVEDELRLFLGV